MYTTLTYFSTTYHAAPHEEPEREEKRDYEIQQNFVRKPTKQIEHMNYVICSFHNLLLHTIVRWIND